jgi:hypothetical protein
MLAYLMASLNGGDVSNKYVGLINNMCCGMIVVKE